METYSESRSDRHIQYLLEQLNPAQKRVVEAPESNMMVVAGAGSGKTRVLIHRFAYLVHKYGVAPQEILAVTFTNKAANEMRTRAEKLLNMHFRSLWMGTFHSIALRILRINHERVGLPAQFETIATDGQLRIVKRLMKEANLQDKPHSAREYLSFINYQKEMGQRARHTADESVATTKDPSFASMYDLYEAHCKREHIVDFAEMLLRSLELLQDNPAVLEEYQRRFKHILVDEFQDSNEIQEAWLRTLKAPSNHIMVVGDDDQSIYGWRGAKVENLLNFNSNYQNVTRFTLDQNYRSTNVILNAANALIKNNPTRLGKNLWTDKQSPELISRFLASSEEQEVEYVISQWEKWISKDPANQFSRIAVLYRNNALSRIYEQVFTSRGIPYRITGGTRFYDRLEIRDAVAYMQLMRDQHSNVSFDRVVNQPKRGIGQRSLDDVRAISRQRGISLWDAAEFIVQSNAGSSRVRSNLSGFLELIKEMQKKCQGNSLATIARICVEDSGLIAHFDSQGNDDAMSRKDNLEELVSDCSRFNPDDVIRTSTVSEDQADGSLALSRFLDKVSLDAGDVEDVPGDAVNLMTLHASKGLEFPLVFIVGMEDNVLPIDDSRIDEERRLVFVGMTRAMDELHLCSASSRIKFGRFERSFHSRFLDEIPAEYVKNTYERALMNVKVNAKRWHRATANALSTLKDKYIDPKFTLGQDIRHDSLGSGTIIGERASGKQIQIQFENGQVRWLISDSPKLHAIGDSIN